MVMIVVIIFKVILIAVIYLRLTSLPNLLDLLDKSMPVTLSAKEVAAGC